MIRRVAAVVSLLSLSALIGIAEAQPVEFHPLKPPPEGHKFGVDEDARAGGLLISRTAPKPEGFMEAWALFPERVERAVAVGAGVGAGMGAFLFFFVLWLVQDARRRDK